MKYPNSTKKTYVSYNTYANRGMSLESDIGKSNEYYLTNDVAIVYKKPTPITTAEKDTRKKNIRTLPNITPKKIRLRYILTKQRPSITYL